MARRRPQFAKIDSNQPLIVAELEACGFSVTSLAKVAGGCPDLVVGWEGVNFLFEVKDGNQPPSKQKLTLEEEEWHRRWKGQKAVIRNTKEALRVMMDKAPFGALAFERSPTVMEILRRE